MYKSIEDIRKLQFTTENGRVSLDENEVPFAIKRIFYIYGSDGDIVRGKHANRRSEFVLINVMGDLRVRVDDGKNEKVILLNRHGLGLYLPAMLWKDMYNFSEDAVLLVLASELYDADEYIRDYSEFKRMVQTGNAQKV